MVKKQSNIRKLTANHKEQGDLRTGRVRHDLETQQLFSVWEDTRIWDHWDFPLNEFQLSRGGVQSTEGPSGTLS